MKNTENLISQKELKEVFHYDPNTGFLIWKINRGFRPLIGSAAGCLSSLGYYVVSLYNQTYYLHHLIYIYHYGAIPPGKRVKFIDGNKQNTRIENLQVNTNTTSGKQVNTTNLIKSFNRSGNVRKNSPEYTEVSGHKEITWDKARKTWLLKIQEGAELVDYGDFPHLEFAIRVLKHCQSSEAFLASHRAPVAEPKPKRNIFKE